MVRYTALVVGSLALLGCGGGNPLPPLLADDASVTRDVTVVDQGAPDVSDGGAGEATDSDGPSAEAADASDGAAPDGDDGGFVEAPHMLPVIPNAGGPILSHALLVTITYSDDANRAFVEQLDGYLVQSPWLTAVGTQYGVGLGTHAVVELGPSPATIDDTGIQALVSSLVQSGMAPDPDGGVTVPSFADADGGDAGTVVLPPAVYMIYFPPTTTVTLGGQPLCQFSGGGYHWQTHLAGAQQYAYAVVSTCPGSTTPQQDLELVASHELIEACTDPSATASALDILDGAQPWSFVGGEVGDLCSFLSPQWTEGSYTNLQRVYSNGSAQGGGAPCLPAPGAYYGTDVEPMAFVAVPAGKSTMFQVKGWSTAPVAGGWVVSASNYISSPASFQPTVQLAASQLDNGQSTTLTVGAPMGFASGSYALILVYSQGSGTDYTSSLVGVYVP